MRVLVVEDEPEIGNRLKDRLSTEGYVPELVTDGETAWFRGGTENYSAAILDLNLPRMDGLSVLRHWRSEGVQMPVLILTAIGAWPDRVNGIDAGADDYLVKPFQMEELLARLRALIRRGSGNNSSVFDFGDLVIDLRQNRVSERGNPLDLTPTEFRLLKYLAHNPGRVMTQEELADNIYEGHQGPGSNAVEVLIGRLRRKFSGPYIQTRRGFGYVFLPGEQ
jgi:two-component system, OmpR family, response regulator